MSRTWHHQPWRIRAGHPVGTRRGLAHGASRFDDPPPDPVRRRLGWYKPERSHVRLVLLAAITDWNTNRDTDIEPDPRQHRHNMWAGGWWD